MEVAGTVVTRRHTVGSPDAAGFNSKFPSDSFLLSKAVYILLPSNC
jgi:hypothetical protein